MTLDFNALDCVRPANISIVFSFEREGDKVTGQGSLIRIADCVLLPYIPSTLLLLVKEVLDDPWPLFANIAICK